MNSEERKLWELYKKTKRRELLERIVEKYLRIVHYLANRFIVFSSGNLERDDLYSAGVIGLLEAIERFDLSKGVEFQTLATIRVRGAIIDEIRKTDWVPRSIRQKSKRIDSAIHSLFAKLGRMPSDDEIAEELDITVEAYYQITDNLGPLFLGSLDAAIHQEGDGSKISIVDVIEDDKDIDFETQLMQKKMREKIISAISQLPDKEKLVISLYYYEELTLKEIGKVLDVSESRISQMHSSALIKLRNMLEFNKIKELI